MKNNRTYLNFLVVIFLLVSQRTAATDPCSSISAIQACGVTTTAVIPAGTGTYNFFPDVPFSLTGKEKIYTFTPAVSGKYTLSVTNTDYNGVQYLYKPASLGCDRYGWTSIGGANSGGVTLLIGNLTAGTPYYFLLVCQGEYNGAVHDFNINCLSVLNPCSNIISMTCGSPQSLLLPAGPGAYDIPNQSVYNGYPNIGREQIYSFSPGISGKIGISVSASNGNSCAYYIKNAALGCDSTQWTWLGNISSTWSGPVLSNPIYVTAGTTYYILADAYTLDGAEQTFSITCPDNYDACATVTALSCSTSVTAEIPAGFGAWDTVGSTCNPYQSIMLNAGRELLYSFVATENGIQEIEVTSTSTNSGTWPNADNQLVAYMIKDASAGCNANGWSCIGATSFPTAMFTSIPLIAGHTYYILLDANSSVGAYHEFNIHCEPPFDPCPSIRSIACSTPTSISIPSGKGVFSTFVPSWYVTCDGKEAIMDFVPSYNGTHLLSVTAHNGPTIFYFIKEATDGCNANNWQFIGSSQYAPNTIVINKALTAGTHYYIMAESYYNYAPPGLTETFELICPTASYNPCTSITNIPACGVQVTTTHAGGLGYMAPLPVPGSFIPPAMGKENIFSFTPNVSGKYKFNAFAGTGTGSITYAIKPASQGCNDAGWKYIGDYYISGNFNYETLIQMELQAGTQYLILADPDDTLAKAQPFTIICAPSPAYNPCANIRTFNCGAYLYDSIPPGNGAYSFNCGVFPSGSELIYSFTPPETGTYGINGYAQMGVNIYYKEAALGCGPNNWTNFACEVWNSIYNWTPVLNAGTEYLIMFQTLSDWNGYGRLSLFLLCQANCTIYADADGDGYGDPARPFYSCAYEFPGYSANNNDCNDHNANIHPGATELCNNNIDDDCDGTIDENCACQLTVNAGADESAYYGYNLDQSVTHTAVVSGGTGPYTYSWTLSRPLKCNQVNSAGDEIFSGGTCTNAVCPTTGSTTTASPSCSGNASITAKLMADADVCVIVTDSKGCTATDCFHINSEDVRCFAGSSTTTKVRICHRTGSTSNPWVQLCISQSAAAEHFAENPYDCFGPCPCGARLASGEEGDALNDVVAYPNPTDSKITIECNVPATYYELFDLTGQLLMKEEFNSSAFVLDLSFFKSGMYFISVGDGSKEVHRTIIKN